MAALAAEVRACPVRPALGSLILTSPRVTSSENQSDHSEFTVDALPTYPVGKDGTTPCEWLRGKPAREAGLESGVLVVAAAEDGQTQRVAGAALASG